MWHHQNALFCRRACVAQPDSFDENETNLSGYASSAGSSFSKNRDSRSPKAIFPIPHHLSRYPSPVGHGERMDVNYQLIAFDMDGTLLSSKKEVLASSRTAIAEALDAGKVVAICTGRCPKMVELDLESIGDVRYAICCNGTILYDLVERRVLSASPLEHDVIARALDALGGDDAIDRRVLRSRVLLPGLAPRLHGPIQHGHLSGALPSHRLAGQGHSSAAPRPVRHLSEVHFPLRNPGAAPERARARGRPPG